MLRILPVLGIAFALVLILALTVKAQTKSNVIGIDILEKQLAITQVDH